MGEIEVSFKFRAILTNVDREAHEILGSDDPYGIDRANSGMIYNEWVALTPVPGAPASPYPGGLAQGEGEMKFKLPCNVNVRQVFRMANQYGIFSGQTIDHQWNVDITHDCGNNPQGTITATGVAPRLVGALRAVDTQGPYSQAPVGQDAAGYGGYSLYRPADPTARFDRDANGNYRLRPPTWPGLSGPLLTDPPRASKPTNPLHP